MASPKSQLARGATADAMKVLKTDSGEADAWQAHVLLIDDNPDDRALIVRELQRLNRVLRATEISNKEQLDAALERDDYDLVVTDYQLLWTTGLAVLRRVKSRDPARPVVMFTGSGSEEIAVEAMKEGLDDYLTKTAKHYPRIPIVVYGLLERQQQRREIARQTSAIDKLRRETAEQLRASEERFRSIHEVSQDGFAVLQAVRDLTNQVVDFVFLYINETAARFVGRPRHELLGGRLLEVLPEQRDGELYTRCVEVFNGGVPWIEEVEYRAEGNSTLFARIAVAKAEDGVAVSMVDTTERRRAEAALRAADRQKDEFLAMLAHELRNPLAPIRNAGELLSRLLRNDSRGQQIVEILRRQVTHLTRLVDDLLDISRITQQRIELKQDIVDLGQVIAQAVETIEPLITARKHDLQLRSSYGALTVIGDQARLVQCIVNLLTNAAKFTEPGGRICLSSRREDGQVIIQVSDNGVGISASLLPRVFELFVQSDRTLDRSQGGLGIGLSVVQRLIEMQGGSVQAASEGPGKGATFTVRLPFVARSEREPTAAPSVAGAPRRILVVDDNVDAANTLVLMLETDGHETAAASTAEDALERVASFRPDLMLLDIGLPDMDGYELAARIRQRAPPHPRLIALTGYGQPSDRDRALQAGFDEHLVKPVEFATLMRVIDAAR